MWTCGHSHCDRQTGKPTNPQCDTAQNSICPWVVPGSRKLSEKCIKVNWAVEHTEAGLAGLTILEVLLCVHISWQQLCSLYSSQTQQWRHVCLTQLSHLISRHSHQLFNFSSSSSSEGQGLFSHVGQDRQWVHRPSPERVLLVKLGTEHLALC